MRPVSHSSLTTLATVVGATLLAGCAGRVEFASLDWRNVDARPSVERIDLDEAYWWTEADGRVRVAIRRRVPSLLFGKAGEFTFQLLMTLDEPPSGGGRNYRIAGRSVRAHAQLGPLQFRIGSLVGAAAIERLSPDRMRVTMRMQASREALVGLTWSGPSRWLLQGVFEAQLDAERGREIAEAVRSTGPEMAPASGPPPTASRPATTLTP